MSIPKYLKANVNLLLDNKYYEVGSTHLFQLCNYWVTVYQDLGLTLEKQRSNEFSSFSVVEYRKIINNPDCKSIVLYDPETNIAELKKPTNLILEELRVLAEIN